MRLRIRADYDDLKMLIIFAVILLYVVAVVVSNISSVAVDGTFSGLNPIPAFYPSNLIATIAFFLLSLVILLAAMGSKIFEFDQGVGILTQKKDEGYSRWARKGEIKRSKKVEKINIHSARTEAAGVPLLYKRDEIWVDNGENHTLVIGATGSGKTQTVILPTVKILSKKRESMIITDPKGEIYEETSVMLRRLGYQILLLNFRDPQNGNAWNPMSLPYRMYKEGKDDKAIELLDDLALNILYDETNKNADPFWEKTSADYFAGLSLGLFEDAKEEEININSINLMSTVGEEKFGGSTYIKEYFTNKGPSSAAAINAAATVDAPSETKGSILSVFRQKVKLFATRKNLSEMLSHSDIDMESIGEKPTAVFVVIQDEKKTYHSLVTIFLKQVYETLIATAQKHGGKLPVRTNFLLDEFANMPPLKDVTTMITAARSRQIRFTMIIQNFAQLDSVYGKDDAETLRGNCGNVIYLVTTELKALEEISKMCGEVKSRTDDKTASTPLVTISDLQHMKENDVIIMRLRMNPFKTHFTPNYKIKWGKKYPKGKYPTRKTKDVSVFDIKTFVKEQKKKKLVDMMNSGDSSAPGGSSISGSPFGSSPFGSSPFGNSSFGTSPFGGGGSDMDFSPRKPAPSNMDSPLSSEAVGGETFNVDDLVKKIDAKIAELEEEERREKEAADKKAKEEDKSVTTQKPDITNESVPSIKEATDSNPVIVNSNVSQSQKPAGDLQLEDDSDDDFFDDFFDN